MHCRSLLSINLEVANKATCYSHLYYQWTLRLFHKLGLCKVKYKCYNTACSGFNLYIRTLPWALRTLGNRVYTLIIPLMGVL